MEPHVIFPLLKKQTKPHSHLPSGNINKAHRGMGQSLTVVSPLTPSDGNDSFLFCLLILFFSPQTLAHVMTRMMNSRSTSCQYLGLSAFYF